MAYSILLDLSPISSEVSALAFAWGVAAGNSRAGSGRGAARPDFSALTLTRLVDAISPDLLAALVKGKGAAHATLTCTPEGGGTVVRYTFDNVLVTAISHSGSAGGDSAPLESIELSYGNAKLELEPTTFSR